VSSSLALIVGAMVLFQPKGTPKHKKTGVLYFWLMIVANVIIPGYLFGKYHWGRHWLKVHISCMIVSYYLLIGGAINEAFLHIPALRHHILDGGGPVLGMTHTTAMIGFIIVLISFLRKQLKAET